MEIGRTGFHFRGTQPIGRPWAWKSAIETIEKYPKTQSTIACAVTPIPARRAIAKRIGKRKSEREDKIRVRK